MRDQDGRCEWCKWWEKGGHAWSPQVGGPTTPDIGACGFPMPTASLGIRATFVNEGVGCPQFVSRYEEEQQHPFDTCPDCRKARCSMHEGINV